MLSIDIIEEKLKNTISRGKIAWKKVKSEELNLTKKDKILLSLRTL